MPMNRVQFQPGLSMPEFYGRYGSEAKCRVALEAARWPNGFVCPACGDVARTTFERGGLRVGDGLAVALRREVAVGEAGVVVGRADDRVEVDFAAGRHRRLDLDSG